jgi:hypothetical protein
LIPEIENWRPKLDIACRNAPEAKIATEGTLHSSADATLRQRLTLLTVIVT